MKKIKKFIYRLGIVSTFAFPLATVISCSDEENSKPMSGRIIINNNDFQSRAKVEQAIANGEVTLAKGWKTVLALNSSEHSIDDGSFNQSSYSGIVAANNVIPKRKIAFVKPLKDNIEEFTKMYSNIDKKSLIVVPGPIDNDRLKLDKVVAATENKAIILLDADVKAKNIASIVFKAHEAGFLAGYMAGWYLNFKYEEFEENGLKVATFGKADIPGVLSFMAGFQNGIKYFNKNKSDGQKAIIFIDNGGEDDYLIDSTSSSDQKTLTKKLISMNADLIFPIVGSQTKDIEDAIKNTKSNTKIIGVGTAQELNVAFSKVVFSALKKRACAIEKMIEIISNTKSKTDIGYSGFEGFGSLTIGTIDNDLVGVSKGKPDDPIATQAFQKITATIKNAAKSEITNPLLFEY